MSSKEFNSRQHVYRNIVVQLLELAFPVTIVAQDGWAEYVATPDGRERWSVTAIRKYNRIGFIVADSEGAVWRLERIEPIQQITLLDRLRAVFQHHLIAVRIMLERADGDPLTVFRAHFAKALENNDDSLTQFHSSDKLAAVINGAVSLPKLLTTLHKMRVT